MPFSQQFRALLKLAGIWALAWAVLGGAVALVRWVSCSRSSSADVVQRGYPRVVLRSGASWAEPHRPSSSRRSAFFSAHLRPHTCPCSASG